MLKNPQTYASLKSEIDEFDREGKLSNPISYAEANKMPYLQAVMKEAMRMHPAVGISMPRYVPPKGAEIDGRWYPGGTVVGVNAWVIHRNKEVFGEDADRFRPERWLEDDSKAKVMARNMYQVSSQPRPSICISTDEFPTLVRSRQPCLYRKEHFFAGDDEINSTAVADVRHQAR
jgi:cytochrome P450